MCSRAKRFIFVHSFLFLTPLNSSWIFHREVWEKQRFMFRFRAGPTKVVSSQSQWGWLVYCSAEAVVASRLPYRHGKRKGECPRTLSLLQLVSVSVKGFCPKPKVSKVFIFWHSKNYETKTFMCTFRFNPVLKWSPTERPRWSKHV